MGIEGFNPNIYSQNIDQLKKSFKDKEVSAITDDGIKIFYNGDMTRFEGTEGNPFDLNKDGKNDIYITDQFSGGKAIDKTVPDIKGGNRYVSSDIHWRHEKGEGTLFADLVNDRLKIEGEADVVAMGKSLNIYASGGARVNLYTTGVNENEKVMNKVTVNDKDTTVAVFDHKRDSLKPVEFQTDEAGNITGIQNQGEAIEDSLPPESSTVMLDITNNGGKAFQAGYRKAQFDKDGKITSGTINNTNVFDGGQTLQRGSINYGNAQGVGSLINQSGSSKANVLFNTANVSYGATAEQAVEEKGVNYANTFYANAYQNAPSDSRNILKSWDYSGLLDLLIRSLGFKPSMAKQYGYNNIALGQNAGAVWQINSSNGSGANYISEALANNYCSETPDSKFYENTWLLNNAWFNNFYK